MYFYCAIQIHKSTAFDVCIVPIFRQSQLNTKYAENVYQFAFQKL